MLKETREERAERLGQESGRESGLRSDNPYSVGTVEWFAYEDGQRIGNEEKVKS